MSFDGGEVKHRRDCVHYPESLTKLWHDMEAEYLAEIKKLRSALTHIVNVSDLPRVVERVATEALGEFDRD